MKETVVKIIRDSIKKNKNAGKTTTQIYRGKTVKIKINPEAIQSGGKSLLEKYYNLEKAGKIRIYQNLTEIEAVVLDDTLKEEILNSKTGRENGVSYSVNFDYDTIYHLPEPEYHFEYENTKLNCNNCNAEIFVDDLEYIDLDGFYSERVCPKCGNLYCCDLGHEDIYNAVKSEEI